MSVKLVEDNLVPEVWTVTFFGSIPITFYKREDMEQYFGDFLHKGNGKIPYEKNHSASSTQRITELMTC